MPDQVCGQGLPDPNNNIQAKKVSEEGVVEIGGGESPDYGLRSLGQASPLSTHAFPADGTSRPPPEDAAEPSGGAGAAARRGPGLGQARGFSGGRGEPGLCSPRPRAVQRVHGRPRARAWPAAAAGQSPGPRAARPGAGGRRQRPRRAGDRGGGWGERGGEGPAGAVRDNRGTLPCSRRALPGRRPLCSSGSGSCCGSGKTPRS